MLRSVNYKYIYFLIVALYALIFSRFGFENFDTGYIPSFSWRIINGQSAYDDFIYKGPPVTLYFHALFMRLLPETGQFYFIRMVNYLMFAIQVWLTVSAFYNLYDFRQAGISKWALMCIGFIVSLLNFPAYPWPTTDGLLFASAAFFLVSKYKTFRPLPLFFTALFCVLSAFTKQSFYLIPLLFLMWIYTVRGFRPAALFWGFVAILVAGFFGFILSITTLDHFVGQTTGETHLRELLYTGMHNYIFVSVKWAVAIMLAIGIIILMLRYLFKQKPFAIWLYVKWSSIILFGAAIIFVLSRNAGIASRIAFDATVIAFFYQFFGRAKAVAYVMPAFVALGIAWSASISLGYQYPIFYATGIMMAFIALMKDDLYIDRKYYMLLAFPVCIAAFSYNLERYRQPDIMKLTHSLEAVSPKLKYIYTDSLSVEKYVELKELVSRYGENFIVAPNIPMANYLFNDNSELPADWIIQTEVNRQFDTFLKLAANKKNYIFLEKSFLQREQFMPDKIEDFSYISSVIYRKFNRIAETRHFIVYNALKKDESLP